MSTKFSLPKQGFVFWPVGTGDSSTIIVKEDQIVVQVDLRHMVAATSTDETAWPVVDELVRLLPKKNGRPYLSLFVLTHPDKDHILGFGDLLKRVDIGEIWHTPRIFRDYEDECPLCEDALVFRKEVHRRRQAVIDNQTSVKPKDRVRVIGHDDILEEDKYKNFPRNRTSIPGHTITVIDDEDVSQWFQAFVHAPFKIDAEDSRNNTSLSLHVTLSNGTKTAKALLFGDREYPTVKQIFDLTVERGNTAYLFWDVLLAPHHCSKKVMYWKDDAAESEVLKSEITAYMEDYQNPGAYLIASARADFTDGDGHLPPSLKARQRYESIVEAGHFLCTHERPSKTAPEPISFELTPAGLILRPTLGTNSAVAGVAAAIAAGRANPAPPQQPVGFGNQ